MMERCEKQAGNKESMKQSEYLYSMLYCSLWFYLPEN